MKNQKSSSWYKLAVLFLILAIIVPVLFACGNNEKEATPTSAVVPTATPSPTVTSTVPTVEASIPTIEGPITGTDTLFLTTTSSDQSLAAAGYEAKEYFVSGTATSYRAVNDLPADGRWQVEPAGSATYKTRIVVYRPVDSAKFNGTLVIEWFNVSGGLDAGPDWVFMHNELLRRGYAWIGVSAQSGGVEGNAATSMGTANMPLKTVDPARYGSLSHPGDEYSYDMFSQVAKAIRNPGNVSPLAGYHIEHILAIGESQSAFRLTTYINAIQPRVRLFDGFLVHSRASDAAPLGKGSLQVNDLSTASAVFLRTDTNIPVLILETETDLIGLGYYKARQDDTDKIRLWEMAGTAHADLYTINGPNDNGTDPKYDNVSEVSNLVPGYIECPSPVNSGPQHFIVSAAIHQLDQWVRTGITPPKADRLEIAGNPPSFVLDQFGNVKGGIRTPYVDVPTAKLSGGGQSGSITCFLFGTTKLFDQATLETLYPDHASYVTAVQNATDAAVKAGFLMPEDGEMIKKAAEASTIPIIPAPTISPITPAGNTKIDINSTIGQLLDNPDTKTVIDNCIPGFSTSPQISMARGMTLTQIQPLSNGAITQAMIDCITAGLAAIK